MKRGRKPADYTLYLAGRNSGKRVMVWYYQVRDHQGKRVQRSTGQTSKGLAQKYVIELIKSGHLIPTTGEHVLFEAFANPLFDLNHPDNYFNQRAQTRLPITRRTYDGLCQQYNTHVRPEFTGYKLAAITEKVVEAFTKKLEADLRDGTISLVLKSLSLILDEAVKLKIITDNPATPFTRIYGHSKSKATEILTDNELSRFLSVLAEPHRSLHDFASSTGARIAECLALQARDIPAQINSETGLAEIVISKQYSDRYGLILSTKGKKSRRNFIGLELLNKLQLLAGRFQDNPDAYLFSDNGYRPITESSVRHHMQKALKLAGITKHIKFHSHRHYANTDMLASGMNYKLVMAMIGHSSEKLQKGYTVEDELIEKNITDIAAYRNRKAV